MPFGAFANILDKQVDGTGLTYKKYILENVSNINFIDPTYIKGISKTGNGGLLMIDLPTTFIQMIREPNLYKIWEDKIGISYIYESSTNPCSPKAENSIVRLNFSN